MAWGDWKGRCLNAEASIGERGYGEVRTPHGRRD